MLRSAPQRSERHYGAVEAERERRRRRRVAAALALVLLGVTAALLFVPFSHGSLEDQGSRWISCGSVVDPRPLASQSEGCVDELNGARYFAYMTGAMAGLLMIGVVVTSPSVTASVRRRRRHADRTGAASVQH